MTTCIEVMTKTDGAKIGSLQNFALFAVKCLLFEDVSFVQLRCLQGMMKTDAGRRRAKRRHEFMEAYLEEFMLEWNAQA